MKDEIAWKEHEVHNTSSYDNHNKESHDEEEDAEDDKAYVFDFFGKDDAYETLDLEFSGLPVLSLRGQLECPSSTGLGMWKGADVLCDYLVSTQLVAKKRVLELGAGVGLCSLVAYHLGASRVLCTDGDSTVLRNLRYNICRNVATRTTMKSFPDDDDDKEEMKDEASPEMNHNVPTTASSSRISSHQLIWGRNLDTFVQEFGRHDVLLAADCIYMTTSLQPLWDTVDRLLEPAGVFLYVNLCASQAPMEKVLHVATDHGFTWTLEGDTQEVYVFQKSQEL